MRTKLAKNIQIGESVVLNSIVYRVLGMEERPNTIRFTLHQSRNRPFMRNIGKNNRVELRNMPERQMGEFQRAMNSIQMRQEYNNSVTNWYRNLLDNQLKEINRAVYNRLKRDSKDLNNFKRKLNEYQKTRAFIELTQNITKGMQEYYKNFEKFYKNERNLRRLNPNINANSPNQFPSPPPSPQYITNTSNPARRRRV